MVKNNLNTGEKFMGELISKFEEHTRARNPDVTDEEFIEFKVSLFESGVYSGITSLLEMVKTIQGSMGDEASVIFLKDLESHINNMKEHGTTVKL